MIQRPQTLFFLAIITICMMLMFSDTVFYTAENTNTNEKYSVEYDETEILATDGNDKAPNTYIMVFIAAIGVLSIIGLFLFKNRKLQTAFTSVNYIFILGLIIMMYLYSIHMNYFENQPNTSSFSFYAVLPMALLFFNFLALKGVRKDEKLVRSMDRLR
ncbi:MAG: hypothetical protein COA58_06905 [Bacteroidetes bacterium]|nr:MAG: hypothetical protein COA58_06905 [Bacteroidota bacterium]